MVNWSHSHGERRLGCQHLGNNFDDFLDAAASEEMKIT
jgi:hypothetical protein